MINYRNLFAGALALAAAVSVTSCGGNKTDNMLELLPVKVDKGDNWSFLSPDGKVVYLDEFKHKPSPVVNGFFYVEEGDGYTVYKAGERPEAVPGLDGLENCGYMSEGRIPVSKAKERIKYYDESGKELFTLGPIDGKEVEMVSVMFREGRSYFCNEDGKYGFIDKDGKPVIKAVYDIVHPFLNGYALAYKDETWRVIDHDGKQVYGFKKDVYPGFINKGKVVAKNGEHLEIITLNNGEIKKLPSKADAVDWFDDELVIFLNDEDSRYGLMTMEGEILLRAKYKTLFPDGHGNFVALNDKNEGLVINKEGEILLNLGECNSLGPLNTLVEVAFGLSTDFEGVIEESEDSYSLFNGKEKLGRSYEEIELHMSTFNDMVRSQYFNAESAARKLASYIDGSSFGGVKLGANPRSFLESTADNYRYSDSYNISGLEGGSKYSISASAKDVDTYFAVAEQIPDGYWYRTEYKYNPASSIDMISIDLTTPLNDKTFGALRDALVPLLKEKGWTVESGEEPFTTMKKGSDHLIIMPVSGSGNGVEIKMQTDKFWGTYISNYTSAAIDRYNEFLEKDATNTSDKARATAQKLADKAQQEVANIDSVAPAEAVGDWAE